MSGFVESGGRFTSNPVAAFDRIWCPLSFESRSSTAQTNVADTWAPNEPEPSEFNSAFLRWKELWTVDACDESIDFEVVYMLHKTGIIDVSVSELQEGEVLTSD